MFELLIGVPSLILFIMFMYLLINYTERIISTSIFLFFAWIMGIVVSTFINMLVGGKI